MQARKDSRARGTLGLRRVSRLIPIALCALAVMAPVAAARPIEGPVPAHKHPLTWAEYEKTPICFNDLKVSASPASVLRIKPPICWKREPASDWQPRSISFGTIINFASWVLIGLLAIKVFFTLAFSVRHHRHSKHLLSPRSMPAECPLVSVIVPCYNEEPTLANCVQGLLSQTYPNLEVLLVDDGSKDETWPLAQKLAAVHEGMTALTKVNGGKASALKYGIDRCEGEIVVCIDADSIFVPDTVDQLVRSLEDPAISAVGGNVRVANRRSLMLASQALEYIGSLNTNTRACSQLGCMQVIPGAIGAFRKDAYYVVGGHSTDTLVEDMDLTIAFAAHGYRVVFNPHALAYTEAPVKLKDFVNQRYRWTFGGMQVSRKYRHLLARRKHAMSWVGLPMHMFSPWFSIVISLTFVDRFWAAFHGHPSGLIFFVGTMAALQLTVMLYMLTIDHESKWFLLMTGLETLFYLHLLNFVTVRAGINYILRREANWHKIPRLGANQLQTQKGGEQRVAAFSAASVSLRVAPAELESAG